MSPSTCEVEPEAQATSKTNLGTGMRAATMDTETIENENVFKRDPGFAGLVTTSDGTPIQGVKVQIYGPDGTLITTVYTDEDGFYMYNCKYNARAGKAANFTVKLQDYKQQQTLTLKANAFVMETSRFSPKLHLPLFLSSVSARAILQAHDRGTKN